MLRERLKEAERRERENKARAQAEAILKNLPRTYDDKQSAPKHQQEVQRERVVPESGATLEPLPQSPDADKKPATAAASGADSPGSSPTSTTAPLQAAHPLPLASNNEGAATVIGDEGIPKKPEGSRLASVVEDETTEIDVATDIPWLEDLR